MASEKVSFGTTCINRENRMGELWGPQPFSGAPCPGSRQESCSRYKPRHRAGLLTPSGRQLMAVSLLPLVSQPTPRPAYTPVPSLTVCSFPRILLASDKSHLSSGLLARFWSGWAIPDKAD